ncbi:band 7 protein AGAP004871 [Aplysia californica]|uniref:Band 7 protein AGAP004871 n=1 Tax=Aplysia californica TaxID=6500 RepID=A0ABM1AFP7_APLCA|nr:band 7 protein AGAP004871 [Aplysia californica]
MDDAVDRPSSRNKVQPASQTAGGGPAFSSTIAGNPESNYGDSGGIGCCGYILWVLSIILIAITFPFSLCLCIKVVQEYERAVIFRLGRLLSGGAKGPGLFFIIPCMDSYTKVDLRTVSFDVPPQEVLTRDSVTVAVDAVVYYRVQNATMSITNVEDSNRSTRLLAATTLRNVLGTKNLSEILSDRENISHVMQVALDEATDPWGVKVERVEVKDVRLPVQLQRAMAAEAEAAREARAKVIAAEGEQKASRALKEAADVMVQSPAALQLRYLQTLNTISAEKNSTIIFPLPIDMLQGFIKK